jgi:hypothetical protein
MLIAKGFQIRLFPNKNKSLQITLYNKRKITYQKRL